MWIGSILLLRSIWLFFLWLYLEPVVVGVAENFVGLWGVVWVPAKKNKGKMVCCLLYLAIGCLVLVWLLGILGFVSL